MSLADFIGGPPALYPTRQEEIVSQIFHGTPADSSTLGDTMIGHPEHLEQHYSLTTTESNGHYFPSNGLEYPSTIEGSPSSSPTDSPSASTSQLPNLAAADTFDFATSSSQLPVTSPTTPHLPEYRPLPPMSPRTILSTLDEIAASQPKKKSHARKQPAGHIPRPRNAFILFRCLFVCQQAVPASVEKDHRNISRIAGRVWKSMSEVEREPWVKAAEIEKTRHEEKWPGYRYNPVQPAGNTMQIRRIAGNIAGGSRNANTGIGASPTQERGRTLLRKPAISTMPSDLHFRHPHQKPEYGDQLGGHVHTPMGFSGIPMHAPQPVPSHASGNFFLHAPVPRVGSVPLRLDDPAADLDFDSDMMPPPPPPNQLISAVQFTHPFFQQHTDAGTPTGTTPTSVYSYDASPQFPPDSPIYTLSHHQNLMNTFPRPPARRSSSCPPLPPGPAAGGNAFSFVSPDPWVGPTPSAYALPPGGMGAMDLSDDSVGATMFRNPFSSTNTAGNSGGDDGENGFAGFASPFGTIQSQGDVDQIRPLTPTTTSHHHPPAHPANSSFLFHTPRYQHVHQDSHHFHSHHTSSSLLHRRGSSLDRAIASSTLAGAFGAFSGFAGQWSRASQQWGQALWASSDTTANLSNSVSNLNAHANSNVSQQSQQQQQQHGEEAGVTSFNHSSSSTVSTPALSPSSPDNHPTSTSNVSPAHPFALPANSNPDRSPSPFILPFNTRKLSTRLFGSQGAHLGLDLDLDPPSLLSSGGDSGLSSAGSEAGPYTPGSARIDSNRAEQVKEEEEEEESGWAGA